MCVVKYMENEEFEWHDIDDIDINGLEIPKETDLEKGTPIMLVDTRNPVWEDI